MLSEHLLHLLRAWWLAAREPDPVADTDQPPMLCYPCPHCGGPMIVIETFEPGHSPRSRAAHAPCPRTPPPSRRKATGSTLQVSRSPKSLRTRRHQRQRPGRQIPMAGGTTPGPSRPAVASPEASPTPADRVRGTRPATAGVRQPFTETDSRRCATATEISHIAMPVTAAAHSIKNGGPARSLAGQDQSDVTHSRYAGI